jgi:hypothetical protein
LSNDIVIQNFLDAAEAWVCDGYSTDIRYLAEKTSTGSRIWNASIALNPGKAQRDLSFQIKSSNFTIGQLQQFPHTKKGLFHLLKEAISGNLQLGKEQLTLLKDQPNHFYSEMSHRDRWFSALHLQVVGKGLTGASATDLAGIDNALRASQPPFDGLTDAAAWLGLGAPGNMSSAPSIGIHVSPPCDLIFDKCALSNDHLLLTLHAHPKFDVTRVGLAVRAVPGDALNARRQIAGEIKWKRVRDGLRFGTALIDLPHADNVLTMLMIGGSTVRRQWIIDPGKARNNRLLAVQHFDKDLRMIRQAVLEAPESAKFEQGIAALLFLLGFTAMVQLETDSPDLIVTTPGGKLVIIECTTRTSDFSSKVGKLVDRRGALSKSLGASGHPATVIAVLICRLPRDQIAAQADELRAHNTVLLTREDLAAAFDRLRFPNDPDQMVDEGLARLSVNPLERLG